MATVGDVRREEISVNGKEYKELVKGTRHPWLKNSWNLTDNQRICFNDL